MIANGAEAPHLGAAFTFFIANRIWLILIASALGHLGAWRWFLDLFAHFRWQYLFASVLCLSAAIYAVQVYLMGLCALASQWNFALIAHNPLATPNAETIAAKPLKVLFANCAGASRDAHFAGLAKYVSRQPRANIHTSGVCICAELNFRTCVDVLRHRLGQCRDKGNKKPARGGFLYSTL